jgi:hypothetical protein
MKGVLFLFWAYSLRILSSIEEFRHEVSSTNGNLILEARLLILSIFDKGDRRGDIAYDYAPLGSQKPSSQHLIRVRLKASPIGSVANMGLLYWP